MTKYILPGSGTWPSFPVQLLRKITFVPFLVLLTIYPNTPFYAADLATQWQTEQVEDKDEWEIEAFANLFFMFGSFGSGTSGGIIAQDDPSTIFSPNLPPTTQLAIGDTSGSLSNLIELGADIYRNHWGLGGSIMFGAKGGGAGSATMGYVPLSHGGTPGAVGTGTLPTLGNAVLNPVLLFNPPIETTPAGFSPALGGVSVSSEATTFRSYELRLSYRSQPDCEDGNQECMCPDKSSSECESRWNVFVGPRYFEFGEGQNIEMEAFALSVFGGVDALTYSYFNLGASAFNEIYGLQIGGEYKLLKNYKDRLDLEIGGRIGFGINNIKAGIRGLGVQFATSPLVSYGGDASGQVNTLFGQLDISASLDLTQNIEISAGYRGLWLENVATLGAQYENLDVATGGGGGGEIAVDDMLMHMGRLGLKLTF